MAIFALLSTGVAGKCDIYHYVDSDGVACFTDSPATSRAVLVVKERPVARKTTKLPPNTPGHLEGTGIGKRITGSVPGSAEVTHVLPVTGRVTSVTGLRHDPIDGSLRYHNGIDIAVASGTPIKPVGEGQVVFSGTRPGYGNMVVVEHDDGTLTVYAHTLVNFSGEGDRVDTNTTMGLTGSSGRSTGPHLHFEAWKNGKNITPTFSAAMGGDVGLTRAEAATDGIRRLVGPDGSLVFTNLR